MRITPNFSSSLGQWYFNQKSIRNENSEIIVKCHLFLKQKQSGLCSLVWKTVKCFCGIMKFN